MSLPARTINRTPFNFFFRIFSPIFEHFNIHLKLSNIQLELSNIQLELSNIWGHGLFIFTATSIWYSWVTVTKQQNKLSKLASSAEEWSLVAFSQIRVHDNREK